MIIGISGRAQSGKDEVGKIIQYLYYVNSDIHESNKVSYEAFVKTDRPNNILIGNCVPEVHKFADNLKDIVCLLTGCTRAQLEDNDFKNSLLPEEWNHYSYASGFVKDEQGNPLMNYTQCSKEKYEEEYRTNWQTAHSYRLSYRQLLQKLGTDLLRNQLHKNVWVNSLMNKYKVIANYSGPSVDGKGIYDVTEEDELQAEYKPLYPSWIITDVRFENEAKAIKDRDGIIIRVQRESNSPDTFQTKGRSGKITTYSLHESETALDLYKFDYVIFNNGTIDDLINEVKQILIKEHII